MFALELALEEVAAAAVVSVVLGPPAREAIAAAVLAARGAVRTGDQAAAQAAIATLAKVTRGACILERALRSLLAALQLDARLPTARDGTRAGAGDANVDADADVVAAPGRQATRRPAWRSRPGTRSPARAPTGR